MYSGSDRSVRYRNPDAKGDLEQYVNRKEKSDQPQRVNRAEKGNPVRGANVPKPKPKPARTAEGATAPVKPKPKPVRPSAVVRTTVAERTTPAPKPKSKPAPAFKGDWKGAAPTAMQARGGARINRGGGLLGLIKKKFGK
jgi:hypothetical protein